MRGFVLFALLFPIRNPFRVFLDLHRARLEAARLPFRRRARLLIQQLLQLLRRVEHTLSAGTAGRTARISPVPLQRAGLAEVVPAPRHDRRLVRSVADDAGKRDVLGYIVVLVVLVLLAAIGTGNNGAAEILLALGDRLPFLV